MKKNLTMGVLVALAMSGVFGDVSFAVDNVPGSRPAPAVERKADMREDRAVKKAEIREERVENRAYRREARVDRRAAHRRARIVRRAKIRKARAIRRAEMRHQRQEMRRAPGR